MKKQERLNTNMKNSKSWKRILALTLTLLICFSFIGTSFAEETKQTTDNTIPANTDSTTQVDSKGNVVTEIPEGSMQLDLSLISSLSGYKIDLVNENGETVSTITLDSRGTGSTVLKQTKNLKVTMSNDNPQAMTTKKDATTLTVGDIVMFSLLSALVTFIITKIITTKKVKKEFEPALEVMYDERID